jgi:cell division cycle protein 20 (cofactor of APC complex)
MAKSVVDYESLLTTSFSDANNSIRSSARPRWERKRQTSGGTVSSEDDVRELGDRFIPNRANMDMHKAAFTLRSGSEDSSIPDISSVGSEDGSSSFDPEQMAEYKSALSSTILGDEGSSRILSFKDKAPAPKGDTVNNMKVLYSSASSAAARTKAPQTVNRHIPSAPSRVLDAPDLLDDYYLNLISWSDTNLLAVALANTVYLWNAASGEIDELCTLDSSNYVSSVQWVQQGGGHLAVGTSSGATQLWDVNGCKQLRSMDGHSERVGALSWNQHVLSSGSKDCSIVNHDVRVANHKVATLRGHEQEVCGLTWSPDGTTLASGANDNRLCLWNASASASNCSPRFTLTDHQAAVKALAWSPHERNLLATGGGTADRCIKFWNTQTGSLLNSVDTGSQVCALQWNPHEKEILSSHGFAKNQLCLWKYPTMAKVKELEGHTARALHMACSPDGSTVVSAGADETLRFWNVFGPPAKSTTRSSGPGAVSKKSFAKTMQIR